jgi:hypothetical protein
MNKSLLALTLMISLQAPSAFAVSKLKMLGVSGIVAVGMAVEPAVQSLHYHAASLHPLEWKSETRRFSEGKFLDQPALSRALSESLDFESMTAVLTQIDLHGDRLVKSDETRDLIWAARHFLDVVSHRGQGEDIRLAFVNQAAEIEFNGVKHLFADAAEQPTAAQSLALWHLADSVFRHGLPERSSAE